MHGSGDYDRKKKIQSSVWRVRDHYYDRKKKRQSSVCWVRGSGNYDRKNKRYSCLSGGLCCCVSFWFWREIGSFFVVAGKYYYDRKKKIQSSVWRVRDQLRPEKKRYSRLSVGCAVLAITTGKKDTVVCLTGCAVVLFFVVAEILITTGKKKIQSSVGRKLAVFLLRREIFITTGKKKDTVICLAGAQSITTGKKKIQSSVCWVRGSGDYDRKKKI